MQKFSLAPPPHPGGSPGASQVPSFSAWLVRIVMALHDVPADMTSTYPISIFQIRSTDLFVSYHKQWNMS